MTSLLGSGSVPGSRGAESAATGGQAATAQPAEPLALSVPGLSKLSDSGGKAAVWRREEDVHGSRRASAERHLKQPVREY